MNKIIVVASVKNVDGEYVKVKREGEFYSSVDELDTRALSLANQKLKVEIQNDMRNAYLVKNGLKKQTSGGKAVNFDDFEVI